MQRLQCLMTPSPSSLEGYHSNSKNVFMSHIGNCSSKCIKALAFMSSTTTLSVSELITQMQFSILQKVPQLQKASMYAQEIFYLNCSLLHDHCPLSPILFKTECTILSLFFLHSSLLQICSTTMSKSLLLPKTCTISFDCLPQKYRGYCSPFR